MGPRAVERGEPGVDTLASWPWPAPPALGHRTAAPARLRASRPRRPSRRQAQWPRAPSRPRRRRRWSRRGASCWRCRMSRRSWRSGQAAPHTESRCCATLAKRCSIAIRRPTSWLASWPRSGSGPTDHLALHPAPGGQVPRRFAVQRRGGGLQPEPHLEQGEQLPDPPVHRAGAPGQGDRRGHPRRRDRGARPDPAVPAVLLARSPR